MKTFDQIVGNTPLVKVSEGIYGKLETYSPTGSVKDRLVHYLISKAQKNGEVGENTTLCEATSGNTGIALSAVAASMRLKCKIFMPSNMSVERRNMMTSLGASIEYSGPNDFAGAIEMRNDFLKTSGTWSPYQFSNPDNVECHMTTTAPEIQRDVQKLGTEWSAFVHGSGTGGTIEGVRRFVIDTGRKTKVCMVQPYEDFHGIQGIGDGKDYLANPNDMDSTIKIKTKDAIQRAKKFAADTGILVGISSGANILACESWKKKNSVEGIVVTMLCDRGERYMSIYGERK